MKTFATSDLHFGHVRILEFEPISRPFQSLEEMAEKLIKNWNSVVSPEDTVYMLGDICMGDISNVDRYVPRLNGYKFLIRGNHDTDNKIAQLSKYVEDIQDMSIVQYKGTKFTLCHYPMREWLLKERGGIHLYGHVHSSEHRRGLLNEPNSFHIGVDTNNLTPVNFDDILNKKIK